MSIVFRRIFVLTLITAGLLFGLGMATHHDWTAHESVREMTRRLEQSLQSREVRSEFERYQAYTAKRLDQSADTNSFRTGHLGLRFVQRPVPCAGLGGRNTDRPVRG